MTAITVIRVALVVELTLPTRTLEEGVGYSPVLLGRALAEQVDSWVQRAGLGYYPPLSQLRDRPGIDPDLLLLIGEMASQACEIGRYELRRRLASAFSSVRVDDVRSLCYTMPKARPAQSDGRSRLARHYAPDTVRAELTVSSLEHTGRGLDGMARLAAQKTTRWLRDHFERFEVCDARLLG